MSEIKKSNTGYAFPVAATAENYPQTGMTLRDYFAGQALEGMIADHTNLCLPLLAKQAYDIADAMLEARK